MVALALAFVAGLVTSLSPCVLPALPIVVGSAGHRHRAGPLALAGGLVVSFTAVGVALTAAGPALGLDGSNLRRLAAIALVAAGLFLLSERLQNLLTRVLAPLASWAARRAGDAESGGGLTGQFAIGGLLGAVWSPCTGPTLGAAVGLAAQGGTGRAALVMAVFGVGAAVPLLVAAYSARLFGDRLGLLRRAGGGAKVALGAILLAVGTAVLTGMDKLLEAALLARMPDRWIDLVTRF